MRNCLLFFVLFFAMMGAVCSSKEQAFSSPFAQQLPHFSLKDPAGNSFANENFAKDGLVLVVTAPILKNKSAQEGWNQHLMKAKSGSKAKLVYLEDLQQSFFKGTALKGMKKDYRSGKEPILLVDTTGKLRQALKVQKKKTVVLVYDGSGKLLYSETGKPSAQAAKMVWASSKQIP